MKARKDWSSSHTCFHPDRKKVVDLKDDFLRIPKDCPLP